MNAAIDISEVTLTTERLVLRPWRQDDLDDFFEYASVDGVGQMAGWLPHESRETSELILGVFIEQKKVFALEHNGKVIGSLGLEEYKEQLLPEFDGKQCREIGFVLSKDYWGRGLMTEAVTQVIKYLFEKVGLDLIVCRHSAANPRSARVQEKCGFKYYKSYSSENVYREPDEKVINVLFKEDYFSA